jgi:hypothetical protein
MASPARFSGWLLQDESADETVSTALGQGVCSLCQSFTFYIISGAGVSGGSVTIETAHQSDYDGAWAIEDSAVTTDAADTVKVVVVEGVRQALRARIDTAITGGTVSVWAVAN